MTDIEPMVGRRRFPIWDEWHATVREVHGPSRQAIDRTAILSVVWQVERYFRRKGLILLDISGRSDTFLLIAFILMVELVDVGMIGGLAVANVRFCGSWAPILSGIHPPRLPPWPPVFGNPLADLMGIVHHPDTLYCGRIIPTDYNSIVFIAVAMVIYMYKRDPLLLRERIRGRFAMPLLMLMAVLISLPGVALFWAVNSSVPRSGIILFWLVIGVPVTMLLLLQALNVNLRRWGMRAIGLVASGFVAAARAARAFPLMLPLVAVIFLTGDIWRVFGTMEWWRIEILALGSLAVIATCLFRFVSAAIASVCRGNDPQHPGPVDRTPAKLLAMFGVQPAYKTLELSARVNLQIVCLLAVMIRVAVSALAVGLALVVFGIVALDEERTRDLVGLVDVPLAWSGMIGGHLIVLSMALLKVAVALSAMAGMLFSLVTLATERGLRRIFANDELHLMEEVVMVSAYYRVAEARMR